MKTRILRRSNRAHTTTVFCDDARIDMSNEDPADRRLSPQRLWILSPRDRAVYERPYGSTSASGFSYSPIKKVKRVN